MSDKELLVRLEELRHKDLYELTDIDEDELDELEDDPRPG
jgi:hypothetical protein